MLIALLQAIVSGLAVGSAYALIALGFSITFNVARAFDEASGIDDPVIWTAERDRQMWEALQA